VTGYQNSEYAAKLVVEISTKISKYTITRHRITRDRQMERQTDKIDVLRCNFLSVKQIGLYIKNKQDRPTISLHKDRKTDWSTLHITVSSHHQKEKLPLTLRIGVSVSNI